MTPADLLPDPGPGTATGTAELNRDDAARGGAANMIRHPGQRSSRVMKHIPRGARFACSRAFTDILQSIIDKPAGIEQWNRLLCFASNILAQPKRSGRRRNMVNVVKKRIDNREFQRTDLGEEQDEGYDGRCISARELFLAAVNAKLEPGGRKHQSRYPHSLQSRLSSQGDTRHLRSNAGKAPTGQLGVQPGGLTGCSAHHAIPGLGEGGGGSGAIFPGGVSGGAGRSETPTPA